LAFAAPAARAADFEVESETIGQGYQLRQFEGPNPTLLDRRRLTEYLNLRVFRILPDDWTGPAHDRNHIYFTSSMRFDTDFGSFLTSAPTGEDRIRELPRSLSIDQFQLLYAVLGGVDMFGMLDFQLGRQIVYDLMDFYSFDGLDVRVRLPWWFAVEAWAGFEVRNEAPLASPIYELDGTSPGSRDPATCLWLGSGNVPTPYRCPDQNAELAPTIGAAIESWGIQTFHGRLAYRRTFSATAGGTAGGLLPESGLNEEKISYTLNASFGPVRPYGGIRYNLLTDEWDELELGVRIKLARHSLLLEYLYNAPTFDGDSIFNVFAAYAYDDLRAIWTGPNWGRFRLWASSFVRFFNDTTEVTKHEGLNYQEPATYSEAYGATAGVNMRLSERGFLRLDGYFDYGFGGTRGGADLSGRWMLLPETLELEGRLTAMYFAPDLQQQNQQETGSLGIQAGARYQMAQGVFLHGLIEENNNAYYHYQLRVLALLDLTFAR
jgi:hypothetical protein